MIQGQAAPGSDNRIGSTKQQKEEVKRNPQFMRGYQMPNAFSGDHRCGEDETRDKESEATSSSHAHSQCVLIT